MAIYGRDREGDEAAQPMVLSEVTFQLRPDDLRLVAGFLAACADGIEAGTFVDGGRHLRDLDKDLWAEGAGDVIVVPTPPGGVDGG
jgi:hypothetical protein